MIIISFLAGVFVTAIAGFFVWRNNKKKFMETAFILDTLVTEHDTREEIEARIDTMLGALKADLLKRAEEELNKLK